MKETIFDILKDDKTLNHLENLDGSFALFDTLSCSLLLASLYIKKPQKIALIASNLYTAQQIYEQLVSLIGEENTLFFPQDEVIRLEQVASSKEMLTQRLYVMEKALKKDNAILITHAGSMTRYLPKEELFLDNIMSFKVGEKIDIKELSLKLTKQGYTKVNKIDAGLEYAIRGDIIDISPLNLDNPIRIDIFDDEIESIRYFTIENQLSFEEIKEISIYPSTDLLLTKEELDSIETKLLNEVEETKKSISPNAYLELKRRIGLEIDEIKTSTFSDKFYKYYSLVNNSNINILDYFKPDFTFVYSFDKVQDSYNILVEQAFAYYSELAKDGRALTRYNFFMDLVPALNHSKRIVYSYDNFSKKDLIPFKIRAIPEVASSVYKAIENIDRYIAEGKKVIVCLTGDQYKTFLEYLDNTEHSYEEIKPSFIPQGGLGICEFNITEGFEIIDENIYYLSPREIFSYKIHVSKFLSRYKKAKIIKSYEELEKGDYVVHEQYGIGQFEEIVTLDSLGTKKDYLKIKYAGEDVLFVPVENFRLVRKYVSKEGAVPKINKMGSNEWKKTKEKIKNRVNDLANRLIALYAERNSTPGYAFKKDDEFQEEFERSFPYTLTSDQVLAVEEIKADMESPHPMDRLLCGDVGFGKTEVAFRAAFKAILSGTQVALLCPTTLLARQHYERAIERFSLFGVNVCMFSRFVPLSTQKKQIEDIKEGKIHFIIGTHRLLSKDIVIPNLKLLIIDEEQRFGVEHKEKIKEMSKGIDCLTLSATPIPRTLQMSLLGMRSLSQLQIAPMNRMPIQTYVCPYNEVLIKEAIEKELSRGGQIFYLHNVTSNINSVAKRIQNMVKGLRVDFVHGKMDKDEIEDVMSRFYSNEIDLLVCTSIIETGLDISNANTIIIENSDHFGLSQLYQIKGRVGRSNRIAYAYLLYDDNKVMTEVAKKRLKSLKDFTELGSGFKIAQRDLAIRGAGDILGPEQAGFIDSVGIDMYIKLLNEVIKEKTEQPESKEKEVEITNIKMGGYIPSNYIKEEEKLDIYQEIQSLNKLPQLELFKTKLIDIYGKVPQEVSLLLQKRKIDILASCTLIDQFFEENGNAIVILTKDASSISKIGIVLFEKLGSEAKKVQATFINRQIKLRLLKSSTFVNDLEKLLTVINELSVEQTTLMN